ncbi:MAG: hypothetical protein QOD99_2759 [Chthoniobacter sp.]|jgi:hypothetical protein|nr:hypothetical protein [Chthoniobacter sp.]
MQRSEDFRRPERLLHQQYRWFRLAWPLGMAAAGLAALLVAIWCLHPSPKRVDHWSALLLWWLGGLLVIAVLACGTWAFRRSHLEQSAQKLDQKLSAKNRLETATSLKHSSDPLARAQREETGDFLSHAPVKMHGGGVLFLAGLVALLLAAHLATLLIWSRPWQHTAVAAAPAKPEAPPPKATIKFITPKSETTAAPVEEVPLEAVADSETGLRDLTLSVEVNGEPKLNAPVAADEVRNNGRHKFQVSIYLDQLEVQPFDIVSYHLQAQRIGSAGLPATVSPVQFVQIKPFREDIREMPGGGGGSGNENFNLAKALKSSQLRLLKENFILAHAEIGHDQPDWQNENGRVGEQQSVLETKTGEAIDSFVQLGMPAEMVNLLTQAKPLMNVAAGKIKTQENEPALAPQGKALGLITEMEKYFIKMIAQANQSAQAAAASARARNQAASDPFEKNKELELKQRDKTPAGELELLAQEQTRLADDLGKTKAETPESAKDEKEDPNRIQGSPTERETQISQRVGALLNGKTFVPEVTEHLENGRKNAREALQQLDAEDIAKSREPAAAAARELQAAAAAMKSKGEEQAREQLAEAMRALNDAADEARNAPEQDSEQTRREMAQQAKEEADQTRSALAQAAQQEQETGSAEEARQLAEMARALNEKPLRDALEKLRRDPRNATTAQRAAADLQRLAQRAAQRPGGGKPSSAEVEQLAQRLERERANLQRLAAQPGQGQQGAAGEKSTGSGQSPGQGTGDSTTPTTNPPKPGSEEKRGGNAGNFERKDQSSSSTQEMARAATTYGTLPASASGSRGPRQGPENGTPNGRAFALPAEDRERFARELIEDLRDDTTRALSFFPDEEALKEVRAALNAPAKKPQSYEKRAIAAAENVSGPLEGVISLLRVEVQRAARQHQLTDTDAEKAPAAYRAAVADYFEQLSRDYQNDANADGDIPGKK